MENRKNISRPLQIAAGARFILPWRATQLACRGLSRRKPYDYKTKRLGEVVPLGGVVLGAVPLGARNPPKEPG